MIREIGIISDNPSNIPIWMTPRVPSEKNKNPKSKIIWPLEIFHLFSIFFHLFQCFFTFHKLIFLKIAGQIAIPKTSVMM